MEVGGGGGREAQLDMNHWNHHVLNQFFMSGYREKVAGEVGGGNQGRFSPLLRQCKADTPLSLIAEAARLRPLKVLNFRNNEGMPSPTLCNAK